MNTATKKLLVLLLVSISSITVAQTTSTSEYTSLLKKKGSDWVPTNYSDKELNEPGMVCVRFNNYWCIKSPMGKPTYWNGQESQDSRGHAQFLHPKYAARAFVKLMHTYYFKHNLRSATDIMNRYAPSTDTIGSIVGGKPNPTGAYAKKIAKELGKQADEDLQLFINKNTINRDEMVALLIVFAKWEITAKHRVTEELAIDGISLAGF